MILLTGAFIVLLNSPVQRVTAVLCALAEDRNIVQGLLLRAQFLDLALFDEIARDTYDVVILKITGKVAQAVRK